jgi:hypothetical protein
MATTEELARRLLAAGVSVDTADMFEEDGHVYRLPMGVNYLTYASVMAESWRFVRPVWSMEALVKIICNVRK